MKKNLVEKLEWIKTAAVVLIGVSAVIFNILIISGFLFLSGGTGSCMEPTLPDGNVKLFIRQTEGFEKGDIVFAEWEDIGNVCKRVVGVPGDEIVCENGIVYINSKLEDSFDWGNTETVSSGVNFSIVLEDGQYFLMGDNREVSLDDRRSKCHYTEEKDITGVLLLCVPSII